MRAADKLWGRFTARKSFHLHAPTYPEIPPLTWQIFVAPALFSTLRPLGLEYPTLRAAATAQTGTTRDLLSGGHHKFQATPFDAYEAAIRQQLKAMLGRFSFDYETGINASTVSRIPHGYAY